MSNVLLREFIMNQMHCHVRLAKMSDAEAVQCIFARCVGSADWLPTRGQSTTNFAAVSAGELVYVATEREHNENNSNILGFVSLQRQESFVHHLFVDPAMQGRGIGQQLLAAFVPWLPVPWQLKCVRANSRALSFYIRLGWIEVGGGESDDGLYALLQWSGKHKHTRASKDIIA